MNRLRELRIKHGLTQAELAQRVNRSKYFISHIENGHALPGRETLKELAHIFDVPMEHLLDDTEPSSPPQTATARG
ncbi:helix-turn-helix domain-containing protein [Sulfobacillus harzensis]|uniref:Helix-turn-helix transcriptional regulator n=1 Tax=Sulfobacillus harzensis TaxID=2729629 RepID=A0A7Y0L4T3_9FIRM|nr:helix-turn-helix transcriptional regulator [Sulfobacillus harzensis]NMP21864.1 helix-turn-helix transcriptional regulator [Sulfobacillus harzensis]